MATVSGEFCVPRCLCTKGWEISSWMFPVMQGDSQGHKKVGREGGEFSLPENPLVQNQGALQLTLELALSTIHLVTSGIGASLI